jgi:hypothetical protein
MTAVVKWVFEDYWQGQNHTVTHYYTGAAVDFVVPDSTSVIQAVLRGGAGGGEIIDNVPGGGTLVVQFPVTPGETLRLRVGGDGARIINTSGAAGAFNGGGPGGDSGGGTHSGGYEGGGATDIRQGGDDLAHRIAAAAAGGGNSGEHISYVGGVGGPSGGKAHSVSPNWPYGGSGATPTAGGVGGQGNTGHPEAVGTLGQGGTGRSSGTYNGAGGGGAGWYGGGGGGIAAPTNDAGGGGGGSNGVATGITVLANGAGSYAKFHDAPMISLEFTEQADRYVMAINPNDGGAISVQKNIMMSQTVGPNRVNILQEGTSQAPLLTFSGVILTQDQLEAMERWYDRRVFIKLTDDLGRQYFGVFSKWAPKRIRRASNFWFHTYEAEFTVSGYKNASGLWVYGRVDGIGGDTGVGDQAGDDGA